MTNIPEYADYYKDKVCIVTGGSTGIGYGIGVRLLECGAKAVLFAARTQSKLDEDAAELDEYVKQGRAFFRAVDVSVEEEVNAMVQAVYEQFGRIDFLFNNAGIGAGGLTEKASINAWNRIIQTNLWSVIYGCHAVLPIMVKQQSGHIINTASIQGLIPAPFQTLYATSKHAVVGLSESLSYEMLLNDVYVSVLCPGAVASEIFRKGGQEVPDTAISIWESADWSLERIANKQVIIPVAEIADQAYNNYRLHPQEFAQKYIDRAETAKKYGKDGAERTGIFINGLSKK